MGRSVIKALWYAADLLSCENSSNLKLLSAHEHVINLLVCPWKHLLIIADPSLEKGPATVCLFKDDFEMLKKSFVDGITGNFSASSIELKNTKIEYRINWRESRAISFAPKCYQDLDSVVVRGVLRQYWEILLQDTIPTASAVLLDHSGEEDKYFRQEISTSFPGIVNAIQEENEQKFLLNCRNIIGMGRGLSPTGDDLVHGVLIAFHYFADNRLFINQVEAELSSLAEHTNAFGRHMLEIGMKGLTPLAIRTFLNTIAEGRFSEKALKKVTAIGSWSGYDIAIAILYFIDKINK